MLHYLQTRIIESDQPVGVKRITNWKLPPKEYAYGLNGKHDKEGVSISIIILSNCISYPKLDSSSAVKDYSASSRFC